jgi:tetratricopeptide (TPR) repeat protein
MTNQPQLPEGYSLPPSKPIPVDEKRLTPKEMKKEIIKAIISLEGQVRQAYFDLAMLFKQTGQYDEAMEVLQMLVGAANIPEEKAVYFLTLGQVMENLRDYTAAVDYYQHAQTLEPADTEVGYLVHNNLGYSLNQLERHEEAEGFCRSAIQIDPGRYNAYKNLGVALEGQGKYSEAVENYIQAFKTNLVEPRAFYHLEHVVKKHPQVLTANPALGDEFEKAKQAFAYVQWLIEQSNKEA